VSGRSVTRTLLALGGGGFTSAPGDVALDDLVLDLTGRAEPRVLFLPTASGDAGEQVARFHAAFGRRPVRRDVLSLFRLRDLRVPLRQVVLEQDAIYVGGGSLRNLLALWREHDLDALLREAYEAGTVLAGLSAGAMCWFQGGVTMSAGRPEAVTGLGLVPGSLSVHRDGEPERLPAYVEAVAGGLLPSGWAVDDGAALLVRDEVITRVVAARPGAGAERVARGAGGVTSAAEDAELLASSRPAEADAAVIELRAVRELRRGLGARR
jgi:peptidase E